MFCLKHYWGLLGFSYYDISHFIQCLPITIYHTHVPSPLSFLLYRFYNTIINPSNLFHFITPSMFSIFLPSSTLSPPSLYSLTNNWYSINPYLLYAFHITSPSSYLPYTQFSYTLHPIFPSVTTIFPSTTSTIPYSMLLFPTTHVSRTLSLLSPALHYHNSRITPTPLLHCTLASMMFLPLS